MPADTWIVLMSGFGLGVCFTTLAEAVGDWWEGRR